VNDPDTLDQHTTTRSSVQKRRTALEEALAARARLAEVVKRPTGRVLYRRLPSPAGSAPSAQPKADSGATCDTETDR
jgi:hypothetical protein